MNYVRDYIEPALAEISLAIASVEDRLDANRIEHEALTGELGELARASEVLSGLIRPTSAAIVKDDPPAPAPLAAHVVHEPTKRRRSTTDFRRCVLDFLSGGPRQPFEIRRHTQSNDKATARRNMNAMAELGLVEATGETQSRRYSITAAGREWLAASHVMSGESKPVDPEPGTAEPESQIPNPESRIANPESEAIESEPVGEADDMDDGNEDDEDIEDALASIPPPARVKVGGYKPGHRQEKPKSEPVPSDPGWWVGRTREQLGEEASRRATTMSASREGRKVRGIPIAEGGA